MKVPCLCPAVRSPRALPAGVGERGEGYQQGVLGEVFSEAGGGIVTKRISPLKTRKHLRQAVSTCRRRLFSFGECSRIFLAQVSLQSPVGMFRKAKPDLCSNHRVYAIQNCTRLQKSGAPFSHKRMRGRRFYFQLLKFPPFVAITFLYQ